MRYQTIRDLSNAILYWHGDDLHLLDDIGLRNWTDITAYARELWHKRKVRFEHELTAHMPPR